MYQVTIPQKENQLYKFRELALKIEKKRNKALDVAGAEIGHHQPIFAAHEVQRPVANVRLDGQHGRRSGPGTAPGADRHRAGNDIR